MESAVSLERDTIGMGVFFSTAFSYFSFCEAALFTRRGLRQEVW